MLQYYYQCEVAKSVTPIQPSSHTCRIGVLTNSPLYAGHVWTVSLNGQAPWPWPLYGCDSAVAMADTRPAPPQPRSATQAVAQVSSLSVTARQLPTHAIGTSTSTPPHASASNAPSDVADAASSASQASGTASPRLSQRSIDQAHESTSSRTMGALRPLHDRLNVQSRKSLASVLPQYGSGMHRRTPPAGMSGLRRGESAASEREYRAKLHSTSDMVGSRGCDFNSLDFVAFESEVSACQRSTPTYGWR